MSRYTDDELHAALTPIASLISKSEKAQAKLAPGTWQHTMLGDNLFALRIAEELMRSPGPSREFPPDDLRAALTAIASMIERTQKAGAKFEPGTSQHSLQRNRLSALRVAETLVQARLGEPDA